MADKSKQENTQNELKPKLYCKRCKLETSPRYLCGCVGGGGGSDDEDDDKENRKKIENSARSAEARGVETSATTSALTQTGASEHSHKTLTINTGSFNLEIIMELLEKKLLTITDNHDSGILTIKCNPRLLSTAEKAAVEEFIRVIKKEFDDFIAKHNISDKSCAAKIEHDPHGNLKSLTMSIRNHELYDNFIDLLKAKKLLPSLAKTLQEKQGMNPEDHLADTNTFKPTPFSKKLKPKGWKE